MVPVHCRLGQDGRKVRHRGVAVLASARSPRIAFEREALCFAGYCGRRIALTRSNSQGNKGDISVLINHVGQMIELVAELEVMGSAPAALEKGNVLIELVVLAGIKQTVALIIGRSGSAAGLLQGGWKRSAVVISCANATDTPMRGPHPRSATRSRDNW